MMRINLAGQSDVRRKTRSEYYAQLVQRGHIKRFRLLLCQSRGEELNDAIRVLVETLRENKDPKTTAELNEAITSQTRPWVNELVPYYVEKLLIQRDTDKVVIIND